LRNRESNQGVWRSSFSRFARDARLHKWSGHRQIDARFTYLGPTAVQSQLGSGETRQQFGLKLHAHNACNLVYAMWRFTPESRVVVSVKRDQGLSTSSECGNRGYQNIKPRDSSAVPAPRAGDVHRLSVLFHGQQLRVFVAAVKPGKATLRPKGRNLKGLRESAPIMYGWCLISVPARLPRPVPNIRRPANQAPKLQTDAAMVSASIRGL
jgi:hypothetical protein